MAHAIARTLDRVRTLFAPWGKLRVQALPSHPDPWRWATASIDRAAPLSDQSQAESAPTAHEREEKARLQRLRRDTLWWATYGVDLDTRDIHACLGAAS